MNIAAMNNQVMPGDNAGEVKTKAAELVGNLFYGTMMKEIRQSTDNNMFSGGFAGQAFQQQLDTIFVSELSKRQNNQIVESMVRQLSQRRSI